MCNSAPCRCRPSGRGATCRPPAPRGAPQPQPPCARRAGPRWPRAVRRSCRPRPAEEALARAVDAWASPVPQPSHLRGASRAPRIVLMDIRMLQLDGIAATRLLASQPSPPAVIVLTTFDADELVLRALQAGAAGFLLKDTPPAEIVRAIELVHGGDGMLSPGVTRRLIALVAGDGDAGERR